MIPATTALALAPPPQPPQPHHLSTSCDHHPEELFTGVCPACLCERLSALDQSNNDAASSKKPPIISAAAAVKALFKPSGGNANGNGRVRRPRFFPELRRTKSFSATKKEGFSGMFELQRKSCDVRARSSLWNLFSKDDQRNASITVSGGEIEVEPSVKEHVLEVNNEEGAETNDEFEEADDLEISNNSGELIEENFDEIVEEREEPEIQELKPMKDYIDLDFQTKKPSVRRSFWSAASVFSKKLLKWRQKQKMKKRSNIGDDRRGSAAEKPITRQLGDTQSENAVQGFGRRSCDIDPRFSLDAGRFSLDVGRFSVDISRISLDDPHHSFNEPRASYDGSFIRRTTKPPPPPSMLSVVETPPVHRHIVGSDMQIPLEEVTSPPVVNQTNGLSEPVIIPGGLIQTRDYYTNSSSRRKKSLDKSSSIKKTDAAITNEPKPSSTNSSSISVTAYTKSTRDKGFLRESAMVDERKGNSNDNNKKSRRWGKWNILGMIYRKSINKYEEMEEEEEDKYKSLNGGGRRMVRSNSNVNWRSSGGGSARKVNGLESTGEK